MLTVTQPKKRKGNSQKVEWQATARDAMTFTSCAELEAVTTEEQYCKKLLEPKWLECDKEMADSSFRSDSSRSGACEFVHVKTESCVPETTTTESLSDIVKGKNFNGSSASSSDLDY